MEEGFQRESLIKNITELEKEEQLVKNIIKTREELKNNNKNFDCAESELVDYYIYQIKANQAKLDYLIKLAKVKGISIDNINQLKYTNYEEEISKIVLGSEYENEKESMGKTVLVNEKRKELVYNVLNKEFSKNDEKSI